MVVRLEVYKCDLAWESQGNEGWALRIRPRSHFHVFCSLKGNHAGFRREDAPGLKFFYDELTVELQRIVDATHPQAAELP
jgi:hypothetical protein